MKLDTDLQRYLALWTRATVEQNKVQEEVSASPAILYAVKKAEQDVFLDGDPGITTIEYDVEVYGTDPDAVDRVTEVARTKLNGFQGQMGLTFVLGGFARDQDSDYVSKVQLATDEGFHVSSFVWKAMF